MSDERNVGGSSRYVRVTASCTADDVETVGGKAVGLGSLLRAGQRVPASFVVTAAAYADYVASGTEDSGLLRDDVRLALAQAYDLLCEQRSDLLTVAVRSSATVEDAHDASFAGQFRTYLGARGVDSVIDQVELCWMTARDPHVDSYRAHREVGPEGSVAVIVQELVHARAAGVMFTQHPRTGDRSLVVIEAAHGLGEAVVGGEITPDLFEVNKITRQVQTRRLGHKVVEHRLTSDGRGVQVHPVEPERQQQWAISDEEIAELLRMAAELEAALGRGLDIEWAIGTTGEPAGTDELFALQVRPITIDHDAGRAGTSHANPIDVVLGRLSGRATGSGG